MFGIQDAIAVGIAILAVAILLYRSFRTWSSTTTTVGCGGCSGCAAETSTQNQNEFLVIEPKRLQTSATGEDR